MLFRKAVAQDNRHLGLSWHVITALKEPTGEGGKTHNIKEIVGDELEARLLRQTVADLKNPATKPRPRDDWCGGSCRLPEAFICRIGVKPLLIERRFHCMKRIELRRSNDGELREENPMQELEHREVRTNANRQRKYHGQSESWRFVQLPNRLA